MEDAAAPAGVGRRLGQGVAEHPKCLLELGGRTLLDRMLDALSEAGVPDVTIVHGPRCRAEPPLIVPEPAPSTVLPCRTTTSTVQLLPLPLAT